MKTKGKWCSICGFIIPPTVDWTHPLYATIDHVIPKSRGGAKGVSNQAKAHLYCNRKKANQIVLSHETITAIQTRIIRELLMRGYDGPDVSIKKAQKRIGIPAPTVPLTSQVLLRRQPFMITKWEDDGGSYE